MDQGKDATPTGQSVSRFRRNPYLILVVCLAAAFLVTATLLGADAIGDYIEQAEKTDVISSSTPTLLSKYGVPLLGLELVGLIAATVAVGNYEDNEQAELDSRLYTARNV